jgi:hypothetical protein
LLAVTVGAFEPAEVAAFAGSTLVTKKVIFGDYGACCRDSRAQEKP